MSSRSSNPGLFALILRRGREERLPQAAGGLAFATALSIVPLLAVSFGLFAHIPALRATGDTLRESLLRGLLPPDITKAVLQHLGQFTGNTSGLTLVGFALLMVSAFALLWSIENTLNRIWQRRKPRPLLRRLVLYACMLLAGPVLLGASLWATSRLVAVSTGLVATPAEWLPWVWTVGPVLLAATGFACLYRFVPNGPVRRRDAIAGGLLAGIAFELGKRGFAFYLANVPTYRTIYGAFAPLLAFLLWIYYSWFVTLAGAVVSACLPKARKLS